MDFWAISTEIEILVLMLITILMDLVLPKADCDWPLSRGREPDVFRRTVFSG